VFNIVTREVPCPVPDAVLQQILSADALIFSIHILHLTDITKYAALVIISKLSLFMSPIVLSVTNF
jgi:hypothetical protein